MSSNFSKVLHGVALLVACSTFVLIVAGGLVTSNDAGLSVPDWPLSYGSLTPPMEGGIVYEHTHRLIAGSVGLLTVALSLLLWRLEGRRWVQHLGLFALLAVVLQVLLGGITVLFLLPTAVSVLHACLAQAFFCLVVSIAFVTSPSWASTGLSGTLGWKWHPIATRATLAIFVQLILGALLRHSGTVEGTKGAEINPVVLVLHLVGALLVIGIVLRTAASFFKGEFKIPNSGLVHGMVWLTLVQLGLGVGSLLVRMGAETRLQPSWGGVLVTTSHVAVGALLLATSLAVTLSLAFMEVTDEVPLRLNLEGEPG